MTLCDRLSDLMPEVARGRAAWTREDTAHLTSCRSCQEEWDLVRAAATHGTAVGMRVDVARLMDRLTRRLEEEPAVPVARSFPLRRVGWPLALAASLSLLVWGGLPRDASVTAEPQLVAAVLHELDDLTPTELEAMLELVPDSPAPSYRTLETPESLGDLSAEELELLLSSMEG